MNPPNRLLLIAALLGISGCRGFRLDSGTGNLPPTRSVQCEFLRSVGVRGSASGCFARPQGIACSSFGRVYVADTGNDRVQEFDADGRYIRELGGFGWSDGQFNRPTRVATGRSLDIWVADNQNRRIARLSQELVWAGVLDKDSEGNRLGYPSGVALNVDGYIWGTDTDTDRLVQLYDDTPRTYASGMHSAGLLSEPSDVACGPDGQIVVADTGNERIVIFDRFGTALRSWGEGVLARPRGVEVTPRGDIIIADTGNHRIVFLNRLFHIVGTVGTRGATEGSFSEPFDVAIDPSGTTLWVADTGNDRIQAFRVTSRTE